MFESKRKLKMGAPQSAQIENGDPHFAHPCTPCILTKTATVYRLCEKLSDP